MLLDVVILAPLPLRKAIGKQSLRLKKEFKLLYAVDNKKLIPHISLFHLSIEPKNLSQVEKKLKTVVATQKAFPIKLDGVKSGAQFFSYGIENSKNLYQLHKKIVSGLKDLRRGPMAGKFVFAKGREKIIQEYGAPWVLKYFSPHITLGGVKKLSDVVQVTKAIPKPILNSFKADEIAIVEVNSYWQVVKIIKEFKLK